MTTFPTAGAPAANQFGEFQVHYATDKQVEFLASLLRDRDWTTADQEFLLQVTREVALGKVSKKAASRAIDVALTLPLAAKAPTKPAAAFTKPASPKQADLISRLWAERDHGLLDSVRDAALLNIKHASNLIDVLFAAPKAAKSTGGAVEGMHLIGGQVIKVQRAVHGSGNLYAKVLNVETQKFEFAPGVVNKTSEATLMTLAAAIEFGQLYGMCCKCGATLTDENSIAAGIGPVCAKGFLA